MCLNFNFRGVGWGGGWGVGGGGWGVGGGGVGVGWGGGYSVTENTQSPKICLNFNFGGGGYSVTENTQSPKIWLNFNFWGVFCN